MLEQLVRLMDAAGGRCEYADARWVATTEERLGTRSGTVDEVTLERSEGVGIRVRAGGAWGFAATRRLDTAGLDAAFKRALAIAEAQGGTRPLRQVECPPARGHWSSPCERDPLTTVSLDEKLGLLLAADAAMRGDPRIVMTRAEALAMKTDKAFASTEGAACTQTLIECGGGILAYAADGDELQSRGYPSTHGGHVAAAGWEHILALDLPGNAPRVAEQAVELLSAPPCPQSDDMTLILHGEQLALQIHESIGHALELDRILGGEASYAGTSWVGANDFGSLRYGSELLNITADATLPGALGSFGWDDEGVPGSSVPLIREGLLRGALTSRESAAEVGLEDSAGCMRAEGFARQPIVRMTNVSIEPGDAGSLEDLIAATGDGVYFETNRSWSIDDRRLHFQFGCEVAREIRGGELGRLYRNPVYSGVTPHFWGGLDAVCSAADWQLWGLTNCGKGEPGQSAHVSHGAPAARFRGVRVGSV